MKLKAIIKIGMVAGLSASCFFSSLTVAQNGGGAGTGPNPFSDCGIGAALFTNDTAAVISNILWDYGTTAVTSATASPETCEGASVAAAEFIHETYATLETETVEGQGSHIAAVFDIFECDASQHDALSSAVREDFAVIVKSDAYLIKTDVQKSEDLFNIMQSHAKESCGVS